jgi:riboflavin kinase / FMN adenylyltransferase
MKVIYGIGKVKALRGSVLAIGVFDGLHVGHRKLIRAAVRRARTLGVPAAVMTFFPHPVQVLTPEKYLPFIVSLPHRLKLMEELGVDACVVIRFTKRFSRLSPRQFIQRYLAGQVGPQEIFVGDDFRFGQGREGTQELFKEAGKKHGFKVNAVVPVKAGRQKIGSSRIRHLILEGKLKAAERLLGRPVSVMGRVVRGDGRGRKLGFPTANITPANEVIPPVGVYAVRVVVGGKRYAGMANVGCRPSFTRGRARVNIETHLFNVRRSLYGKEIIIEFARRLRAERCFASVEAMTAQLKRDETKARRILGLS